MQFFQKIMRTASVPLWAKTYKVDGADGWWQDLNIGQPVFLRSLDGVVWLPRAFRGRKLEQLTPEIFDTLPPDDTGKAHYEAWRQQFDMEQEVGKLHNGYAFQPAGMVLIERLKKLVEKYELEDVSNIGLDPKFSINPMLFDKLLQTNNRADLQRIGRVIAKKFALVVKYLELVNPKMAKRLDADFMFQYKKLKALFNFDLTQFNPPVPTPEEYQAAQARAKLLQASETWLTAINPHLNADPQMLIVAQACDKVAGAFRDCSDDSQGVSTAIKEGQVYFSELIDLLNHLSSVAPTHPVGQTAIVIQQLPETQAFEKLLSEF